MGRTGKFRHWNLHSGSGFTLIELLTVIAIIGILAALTFPAISRIRLRGRIAAVKEQLRQIETAIEQYYADYDTYPPMGNDWLGGQFFPSEDVGTDGKGPFNYNTTTGQWEPNNSYTGPDDDGTEGNYVQDSGAEDNGVMPWLGANDPTAGNGRLDGTYYDRLGMFADQDKQGLIDVFAARTYYHYYAGYVYGKTDIGMPKFKRWTDGNAQYGALDEYAADPPPFYNKWVIYSVGPDGTDHALHNYYLTMQDGEDVGPDAFASDPTDLDGDRITFEPNDLSAGENDSLNTNYGPARTVIESGFRTPATGSEQQSPGGNATKLEGPKGEPVFSYDVREQRRREKAVYITPDGDKVAFGPIMRYGP